MYPSRRLDFKSTVVDELLHSESEVNPFRHLNRDCPNDEALAMWISLQTFVLRAESDPLFPREQLTHLRP